MGVAEILEMAKALSIRERKELVKQLVDTFGDVEEKPHSILELAGIDAQEYVNGLRREWENRS